MLTYRTRYSVSVVFAFLATVAIFAGPSAVKAGTFDGTLALGGAVTEEDYGDLASIQETYNIYDGFRVTRFQLNGIFNPKNYFRLNLRDINLASRKGDFVYRVPGTFQFTSSYRQNRWVFDPERVVTSDRKNWRFQANYRPAKSWRIIANYGLNHRNGNRLSYPLGTSSWLGTGYDYLLNSGGIEAQYIRGPRGLALRYDITDFSNKLDEQTDRRGHLVSARIHSKCKFYDKWTHFVRGSYGKHNVPNAYVYFTLANIQYTGVVRPIDWFQFKYNLYWNRVYDRSTALRSKDLQNNFDADFYYKFGRVFGGYGYETNNDDLRETNYNTYRLGATFNYQKRVYAKVNYSNRAKNDVEKRTLLKDIESDLIRGELKFTLTDELVIGGHYVNGEREFPDIGTKSTGQRTDGYLSYTLPGWITLYGDYSYNLEEHKDRVGTFDTDSQILTSRLTFDRVKDLMLAGGVRYVRVGKDLDIRKYILSFEGEYTIADVYHLELKYNVYDYDDYLIQNRYYKGDVVWFNVAYDFGYGRSEN